MHEAVGSKPLRSIIGTEKSSVKLLARQMAEADTRWYPLRNQLQGIHLQSRKWAAYTPFPLLR
jgi:hypothetical protein